LVISKDEIIQRLVGVEDIRVWMFATTYTLSTSASGPLEEMPVVAEKEEQQYMDVDDLVPPPSTSLKDDTAHSGGMDMPAKSQAPLKQTADELQREREQFLNVKPRNNI
jgi:hypothetical protein